MYKTISEIKAVNKGMDVIDKSLDKAKTKERHFIEGNHDDWLNRFVEENPYLGDTMSVPNALKLKERGYKYHRMGKYLKIGKINFYHGHLWLKCLSRSSSCDHRRSTTLRRTP